MQIKEVGIKFKNSRVYSFSPNNIDLKVGDLALVDTTLGQEIGRVVYEPRPLKNEELAETLKPVIRKADEKDVEKFEKNREMVRAYKKDAVELVKKHGLDMKIAGIDCSFDMSKIIISFTSENRVDFRDLVKELASKFKTRIELRQIGARDEVKMIGGMGPCGRECCCCKALDTFEHVTIKMAKTQGLSLNPTSISGLCGRLMCCLAYENPHYTETFKLMPKVGTEVETPEGKGMVLYNDLLDRESSVKIVKGDSSEIKVFKLSEMKFKRTEDGKN